MRTEKCPRMRPFVILGIIAFAVILVYCDGLRGQLVFDDLQKIRDNPAIRSISGFLAGDWWSLSALSGGRRPLTYLSFAINWRLHGLAVSGYRVVNLGLHILVAWAVFFFSRWILRRRFSESLVTGAALFVALLFAVHPAQTQAVVYLVQRAVLLSALFYLGALACYLAGRTCQLNIRKCPPAAAWYCACALCGLCALWSKENAASLPLALLLAEICFVRDACGRRQWKVVLIGIALLAAAIGAMALAGHLPSDTVPFSRWQYGLTQFRVIAVYLRLLALPVGLNLDYDFPVSTGIASGVQIFSLLLVLGLFGFGLWSLRRNTVVAFGILWFFVTLSVESSVIPLRDVIFEHRLYLPAFGVFLAVTSLALAAADRLRIPVRALAAAASLLVLMLGCAAHARVAVWQSPLSLWSDVIAKSPRKPRGYVNRGLAREAAGDLDGAAADYTAALAVDPSFAEAYNNRGIIMRDRGELAAAIADFSRAIACRPYYADAYNNRGAAQAWLGQYAAAIADFDQALQYAPRDPPILYNRARARWKSGDRSGACADWTAAADQGHAPSRAALTKNCR